MLNVDYTQKTPQQLRCCYRRFVVRGDQLPDELIRALKAAFPCSFDAEKQIFTRNHNPLKPVIANAPQQQYTPALLYSVKTTRGRYKLTTPDNRVLLVGATTPYELCLYDHSTSDAVVRKYCEDDKNRLFVINCDTGTITDATRESGASNVAFVPGTHELLICRDTCLKNMARVYDPQTSIIKRTKIPDNAWHISASKTQLNTVIINQDGTMYTTPLIALPNTLQPIAPESTMMLTPISNTPEIQITDMNDNISPNTLRVHTHMVSQDMNGKKYYNVYVNGRRIVENNIDTSVQMFMNGALLGVYGMPANHPTLPRQKLWQLFSTDLKPRLELAADAFTGQPPYIKTIFPGLKQIRIHTSDRVSYILELGRELKRAKGKTFEIVEQKQK